MSTTAIEVDHVWKNFRLYHEHNQHLKAAVLRGRRARYEEFWALRNVSLSIPHGATFGLIGSNGSGKSTLLKCLAQILYPNKGSIRVSGRLCALLELGAGFHPELSGRENIYLNGAILGLSRRGIDARFDEIVEFAGLERFIDTPVKSYSNGMQLRLGFSIASYVDPEILLIDEVLAVGDQAFQKKCADKIETFRREGRTIVVVSHGLSQIMELCTVSAWLEKGEIRQIGPSAEVINAYTSESFEAAPNPSGGTGARWGTGEIQFSSVELLGRTGPALTFEAGDSIQILVQFSANANLQDSIFAIELFDDRSTRIWATNSRKQHQFVERLKPEGSISITLLDLPLLSGKYLLSVGATSANGKRTYDWWDRRIAFTVISKASLDQGILALESTWDLSGARR
jgi:ABC-2 type transport system ATP-binding protein